MNKAQQWCLITAHLLLLVFTLGIARAESGSQAKSQNPPSTSKKKTPNSSDSEPQGEAGRLFQQNCSRCHTAPDGFSPRISSTILRHMRVRASLSKHDEEELMHFMNP